MSPPGKRIGLTDLISHIHSSWRSNRYKRNAKVVQDYAEFPRLCLDSKTMPGMVKSVCPKEKTFKAVSQLCMSENPTMFTRITLILIWVIVPFVSAQATWPMVVMVPLKELVYSSMRKTTARVAIPKTDSLKWWYIQMAPLLLALVVGPIITYYHFPQA